MAASPFSRPDLQVMHIGGQPVTAVQPPRQVVARVVAPAGPTRGPVKLVEIAYSSGPNHVTPSSPAEFEGVVPAEFPEVRAGDVVLAFPQDTIADYVVVVPQCCATTTSTAGPFTTGTSTTPQPCTGGCTWIFDHGSGLWAVATSTCGTNCACLAPDYCPPPGPSACAVTSCGILARNQVPVECAANPPSGVTTTASASCTTTTNSACTTGCDFLCVPGSGWSKTRDGCPFPCSCSAPSPDSCAGSNCTSTSVPCNSIGTIYPPGCSGQCAWAWDSVRGYWVSASNGCASINSQCVCAYPAETGTACGDRASTVCYTPEGPGSPSGTTQSPCLPRRTTPAGTPSPGNCNSRCLYVNSAGSWSLSTGCATGCTCPTPSGAPSSSCSQTQTACGPTTTTTASPTTTSTTPPPCLAYTCAYRCSDIGWVQTSNQCVLGRCACPGSGGLAACPGVPGNTIAEVSCVTSTTTTPSGTTTASGPTTCGPGVCNGQKCWFLCVQYADPPGERWTPVGSTVGCGAFSGCSCPAPADLSAYSGSCPPGASCTAGQLCYTPCTNCATTTPGGTTTTASCASTGCAYECVGNSWVPSLSCGGACASCGGTSIIGPCINGSTAGGFCGA